MKFHCDLWGPAPIWSYQHFRYYAIFVDKCTRFTWFFPLRHKSEFLQCFTKFYKFIHPQFDKKIRIFQTDGGGKFSSKDMVNTFSALGIHHQLSCPRTPGQNFLVERKRRNVTELGQTMLFHSGVPKRFWVETFGSAVWLINRLPSRVLDMHSPFAKLFNIQSDDSSLRVFGCQCFPYLHEYVKTKFDPRLLPCVFMGFSHQFKGYRCFYPPTGRVYLSHHMVFDEITFSFKDPGTLYSSSNTDAEITSFHDWFTGVDSSESPQNSISTDGLLMK